jgi:hypothetical protein
VSDITFKHCRKDSSMKRFALGIIVALAIALIGGATQTSAAPSAPKPRPGHGIGGQVASVDGTTITVTTPQGSAKIATTNSTTFEINGASGSLSGVTTGMFIRAEGTKASDGTFTATRIVASSTAPRGGKPPKGAPKGAGASGQVTSVDGTTIIVTTPKGTANIATTSLITFEINGASGSLSGITTGMFIRAEGTKASDGTFTATRIVASSTRPAPPKHR